MKRINNRIQSTNFWFVITLVCVTTCMGCQTTETSDTGKSVTVLAAASTGEAMFEVSKLFEQQTNIKVIVSTGASNTLAQQILSGAPADLFLSANVKWARLLAESGQIATMKSLLTNRLVLVVPESNPANISTLENLRSLTDGKIALAGEHVPAGIYSEQALREHELWERLNSQERIVRGQSVRTTLTYVQQGEVAAGIVYMTDVRLAQEKVKIIHVFEESSHDEIVYPVSLIRTDMITPAAEQFFDFLQSRDARMIFQQYGFKMANIGSATTGKHER